MPFSLEEIAKGGVVPVAVALVVCGLIRWTLRNDLGDRYGASTAITFAFLAGYALLGLAPWLPKSHWHWLPYCLMGAGLLGAISSAQSLYWFERLLLCALVASASSWLLTPTWEDLEPSRLVYASGACVYITILACMLEPLAARTPGPLYPGILWLTMTASVIVLGLSGNLRIALVALPAAAALFGVMLLGCVQRDRNWMFGAGLFFSVVSVGAMLVGRVNSFSNVPLAAYMMVPAAPLLLWLGAVGPLAKISGAKRPFIHAALPILMLAAAVTLAVIAE